MRRFRSGWSQLVLASCWLLGAGWLSPLIQAQPPDVFARYFEARCEALESEARRDNLDQIHRQVGEVPSYRPPREEALIGFHDTIKRVLQDNKELDDARRACAKLFRERLAALRGTHKAAKQAYLEALRAEDWQHQARAEVEWQVQQAVHDADSWRRYVSATWALVAVSVASLAAWCWLFEQRVAVRRQLRRRGRLGGIILTNILRLAIVGLVTAPVAMGALVLRTSPRSIVRSPEDDLRYRTGLAESALKAHARSEVQRDQEQLRQVRETAAQSWNRLLVTVKADVDAPLLDAASAEDLESLLATAAIIERYRRQTMQLKNQVLCYQDKLKRFAAEAAARNVWVPATRSGVLATVVLFGLTVIVWPRWQQWRRRRQERRQCPRCMQTCLEPVPQGKTTPTGRVTRDLHCQGIVGETRCAYRFPAKFSKHLRLYLPVYGQAQSGKTTWLTFAYQTLNSGSVGRLQFSPIRTNVNVVMDGLVKRVLVNKQPVEPTKPDQIVDPLLYQLVDGDIVPSHFSLDLLSFSRQAAHFLKAIRALAPHRALTMNGFLFFIDPTMKIEEQLSGLVEFYYAWLASGEGEANFASDMPVAICVTKLDLVRDHTLMYHRALPWLANLGKTIGRPTSLALLRERSALVDEIQLELFRGFDLRGELRQHFGPNVMLFPQTCFGLQVEELGLPLQKRGPLMPFGIVEPIQWLLHMNGLQALA